MKDLIKKHALHNAIQHKGKANIGAVMSRVLGEDDSLRTKAKEISQEVQKIVKEINSYSKEKQLKELKHIAPELLEERKEERNIFGFLNINPKEKVITCFPPEPSKFPHLGHAKAVLLNYELAKQYEGKFLLRFDDTNPNLAKKEFYEIIENNLKWLGLKLNKIVYASDYMETFYEYAEKLINLDKAYVCNCNQELIKLSRQKGLACNCQINSEKENLKVWNKMLKGKSESILRLKIDLKHQNSTMRDPTIFRIIKEIHPRTKNKYKAWPSYDFETPIMDGILKVTHRLRSKEFELRTELHNYIQDLLQLKRTTYYEFGRLNLEGVESSGRKIRELIKSGELMGWDDPSLTTIVALKRRGFQPEAIKEFVLNSGISKAEATLTWDDLYAINRRIIDFIASRYFGLYDYYQIEIKNSPKQEIKLPLHPGAKTSPRKFKTINKFFIQDKLFNNETYRLMDCLNFKYKNNQAGFLSKKHDKTLKAKLIHWLPVQKDLSNIEIMFPDKSIKKGIGEPLIKKLKVNDIIQFPRLGFARVDSKEKDIIRFWFTHN